MNSSNVMFPTLHMSVPRKGVAALRIAACGLVSSLSLLGAQAASTLAAGNGTAGPGDVALVNFTFQGDTPTVGLQFDVRFDPTRISAGYATVAAGAARHIVASSTPAPGVARVVVYSLLNQPLVNGAVVTLPFRVAPTTPAGTTSLSISNAILAGTTANRLEPVSLAPGAVTVRDGAGPTFRLPVIAGNGQVTLRLDAPDGQNFVLQRSVNLSDWFDLSTDSPVNGVVTFLDSPLQPFRFYRAREVP